MDPFDQIFTRQKSAFAANPYPAVQDRKTQLSNLDSALKDNKEKLIAAINQDFGCRSRSETILAEIIGCHGAIHYAQKNLARLTRKRKHRTSIWFKPAKNYVIAQPLGVVGIMAPWNYSLHLAISPLVAALAAGNRAMVWMSEETPTLAALLHDIIAEIFDHDTVAIVTGGPEQGAEFAALPFDHLLFTGSTRVGRLIAIAAAKNLTPVTLELGGKSPALVAPDYSIAEAATRITWGKTFNAGQTCIAPDYALVPEKDVQTFANAVAQNVKKSFKGTDDTNYTAIISERFYTRLNTLIEQARAGGAEIIQPFGPAAPPANGIAKIPVTLILNPPADSALMQEEIFGPILPVLGYSSLDDAIATITTGDKPLALYCFSNDKATTDTVMRTTHAGGMGINDVLMQYAQEDLPFGGVGPSGIGSYHGQAGFDTFSHLKSVFEQRGFGNFTGAKLLYQPHGHLAKRLMRWMGG